MNGESVSAEDAARTPAYQLLADEIRDQITSGRLRPGERLPTEPQLCLRAGVSRSTVREALRLLASQHLIVTTRGVSGGSFVAYPSPEKMSETLSTGVSLLLNTATISMAGLLEMRETIEVPAVALAAHRRGEDDLAALRRALFDPETDSPETMLAGQRAFHRALAAATGNVLFSLLIRPLYELSHEWEPDVSIPAVFWRRVDAEHREILQRVAEGDAAGAARAARAHLVHLSDACTRSPHWSGVVSLAASSRG